MRRTFALVLAVMVALVVVLGASAATIKLGEKANGTTVQAKVGDLVHVRLASNASTGYAWEVAAIDGAKLRVLSAVYTPPKAGAPPGAGGTYTLMLRVRSAGRSLLKLEYVGPPRSYTLGKSFAVTIVAG